LASVVRRKVSAGKLSGLLAEAVEKEKSRAAKSARIERVISAGLPRTFLDTNILLYCDAPSSPAKQKRALQLIIAHRRQRTGVVSLQVLQEYFVNATRKLGIDPTLAKQKAEIYARFQVVEPLTGDLLAAIDLSILRRMSLWDALIVHCARRSGCSELLTEDLQHGQVIDGLRIVNPFLED
jgi:predicted nucleic acid-binding protein